MLGSLISAGASLLGGFMGSKNADKQAALQKEFAQNQLQWKAADAEKAGISKIFAMGAPTMSYSPVSTGDYGISSAGKILGEGIEGQQSGRGTTTGGKITGIAGEVARAQLEGLRIDNDIKRATLASKVALATQPGAGGVLDHDVTIGPEGAELKRQLVPGSPGAPQKGYGTIPEVDMYRTPTGWAPAPPQNLSEVHENNALMRWQWMARNQLLPFFDDINKTPPGPAPAGAYWSFNPMLGEYSLVPKSNAYRAYESWWSRRNRQEVTR